MLSYYLRSAFNILRDEGVHTLGIKVRKRGIDIFEEELLYPTIQWWKYGRHYVTNLDACQHLWVNPDEIFLAKYVPVDKDSWNITHVIGGDWDTKKLSFENNPLRHQSEYDTNVLYQSLYSHFKRGTNWKNTALFDKVIHGDMYWRGIQSEPEFKERCRHLDQLFDDMQEHGYRTYEDIHNREPTRPREIQIMIGRNGNFFFVNGKHRLSIAKILELDQVAVNITVRHKYWQELRDSLCTDSHIEKDVNLHDHPDLQDILD